METNLLGYYVDPKHGTCLRRIRCVNGKIKIDGVYGDDEPTTNEYWYALINIKSICDKYYLLDVDFGGKPTKKKRILTAKFFPGKRCIKWEDGNTWKKLYYNNKQFQ